MKPLTSEWVAKAEGDFATLVREGRVRKNPNYDGMCFHAQQCAEKYLKARLSESGVSFGRMHDLVALLDLALSVEPAWEELREHLAYLSDFAVTFRYPGDSADRDSAMSALMRCRLFRKAARKSLGLDPT
jgi:HEPN domain-containing protein